jgi:hypothetical protein
LFVWGVPKEKRFFFVDVFGGIVINPKLDSVNSGGNDGVHKKSALDHALGMYCWSVRSPGAHDTLTLIVRCALPSAPTQSLGRFDWFDKSTFAVKFRKLAKGVLPCVALKLLCGS